MGLSHPFRKLTLDVEGAEPASTPAVFEWQQTTTGKLRLLVAAPPDRPELFRTLASCLCDPLILLYVLHTPRGEGLPGRYQSPELTAGEVDAFLAAFEAYFAGDGRHDLWVHSASDARTLIWDRHDTIYVEGERLEEIADALERTGLKSGVVPRPGLGLMCTSGIRH